MQFFTATFEEHDRPIGFTHFNYSYIELDVNAPNVYATTDYFELHRQMEQAGSYREGFINPYAGLRFHISSYEVGNGKLNPLSEIFHKFATSGALFWVGMGMFGLLLYGLSHIC